MKQLKGTQVEANKVFIEIANNVVMIRNQFGNWNEYSDISNAQKRIQAQIDHQDSVDMRNHGRTSGCNDLQVILSMLSELAEWQRASAVNAEPKGCGHNTAIQQAPAMAYRLLTKEDDYD